MLNRASMLLLPLLLLLFKELLCPGASIVGKNPGGKIPVGGHSGKEVWERSSGKDLGAGRNLLLGALRLCMPS